MLSIATFAAVALCVGLLALLARMAEEGLGWAPAGAPQGVRGVGYYPTKRRPAGWAHRLAQACRATLPVRMVRRAQAQARRQLAAARVQARQAARDALAARGRHPAIGPVVPTAAPAWPPRAHARQAFGQWLVRGDWCTPLAEGTWG